MKKFYMILAAIAAMTMTAQAQNWATIDVGDWDNATTYNGSYFDMAPTNYYVAHTGVQMLYTPDMLADMQGKQNVRLTGLTFMFHCETFEDITRDIVIFVQEVDATEFAVNDEGIKQFFPIEVEPVVAEERTIEMLDFYGEDVQLSFRFNVDYTSGKSLLVTMAFDAQDDDNCTMGSDYAPFYTSGMGKAMTYTNNWTGFYDFTQGDDFPNATASLGCGTNVSLPLTRISYSYEESSEPTGIVPANPTADEWYDCGDESGFSKFYFTLPTTDVDGNMLEPEFLSYSIFIDDDQLFTFPAEDYTFDLYDDITEVTYDLYNDAVDFKNYFVYFYRTNAEGYEPLFKENIGIQVYYTINGVKNASNIVYLYDKPQETPYYVIGGFNGWAKDDSKVEITDEGANITVQAQDFNDSEDSNQEFKIITADADAEDGWRYFGGVDEYDNHFMLIYDDMIDNAIEITLDTPGANFRLPAAGTYNIRLVESRDVVEGLKMVVSKPISTAVNDISAKAVAGIKYVNIAGMESNKPFDGVNIVVTTYTDGTKAVQKVLK